MNAYYQILFAVENKFIEIKLGHKPTKIISVNNY